MLNNDPAGSVIYFGLEVGLYELGTSLPYLFVLLPSDIPFLFIEVSVACLVIVIS